MRSFDEINQEYIVACGNLGQLSYQASKIRGQILQLQGKISELEREADLLPKPAAQTEPTPQSVVTQPVREKQKRGRPKRVTINSKKDARLAAIEKLQQLGVRA